MSTTIFINAYQGKTKNDQRDFDKVTVAYLKEDKSVRIFDLFSKDGNKLPGQDNLKFGDIVDLQYEESEYPGGRPQLIGIKKLADSPY